MSTSPRAARLAWSLLLLLLISSGVLLVTDVTHGLRFEAIDAHRLAALAAAGGLAVLLWSARCLLSGALLLLAGGLSALLLLWSD